MHYPEKITYMAMIPSCLHFPVSLMNSSDSVHNPIQGAVVWVVPLLFGGVLSQFGGSVFPSVWVLEMMTGSAGRSER